MNLAVHCGALRRGTSSEYKQARFIRCPLAALLAAGMVLIVGCGQPRPALGPKKPTAPPAVAQGAPKTFTPGVLTQAANGKELYVQYCAACHGENGDGRGPAAVFLYPKPRNFRAGKFRLVSTANRVPTRDDLESVLVRGMPGSSMPPWSHLSAQQRAALVDEVIRLRQDGARQEYVALLKAQEELSDEEIATEERQKEIADYVATATRPGELQPVPELGEATAERIARGRAAYFKQGCDKCHGEKGRGDGQQQMKDDEGLATRPRDLVLGIYKGGHDEVSVFRRIAYGMPGTPMPSSANLISAEDSADLTHFILSLSTPRQREAAVGKRHAIRAARVPTLPADASDSAWGAIPALPLSTFPLWWRDNADPGLRVQAAHDGKILAIRLQWNDATRNDRAELPDQFEDMAAVQLYRGTAEPFLGMGAAKAELDVWQWRAGRVHAGESEAPSDEYPFDTPVYRELAKGQPLPDFIAARAAGNPLAVRDHSADNLHARGFGSLTFRTKPSQLVTANSARREGEWMVVLQRPLAVSAEQGLTLAPGETVSAAFAIWEGSARDRGSQKSITIWHDFKLD